MSPVVDQTLELLAGMQKLRLYASRVVIDEKNGVTLEGIALWSPPVPSIEIANPDAYERDD